MSDFINENEQITHHDSQAEAAAVRQEVMQDIAQAKEQPKKESQQDQNWRLAREESERYRKEAEELRRKLESQRGDDELVEYKQLKQMKHDIEQQTLELRLKSKFTDFDDVVNSANLKKLADEDPELAYTIDSAPDMYTKAVAAYKMIKAKQPIIQLSEEDENFYENSYKPRSTNSLNNQPSDRPLSQANAFQRGLTKEMKEKLFAEMVEAQKNR